MNGPVPCKNRLLGRRDTATRCMYARRPARCREIRHELSRMVDVLTRRLHQSLVRTLRRHQEEA